ncbi:ABC transporter related [Catenulispora acidiphila DSM 44928]|uniref:ABC transporter related n=1 Tax=Catenulispora acidiphila (strain DSM 44928 / JCM 14897 / NBRC 102108 / NRRL B-24433 / ID139908) TaxID=479433 RepID=C7Q0U0_CATAD|nr:ABC transporter ATP-binding protein [Catenulispora acidiphila]ACU69718.1 ABC transporter related [Catenulispora acidiphila DSM 44928]
MRLELRGITKTFGSVAANSAIDLTVEPGEIHCLLGENGAGKSTLMNILYGLLTPDSGEIVVDGVTHEFSSPGDAIKAGIGMVHQHFMLVPVFTVADNLMLGHEEARGGPLGWLDRRRARQDVKDVSARYGLPVDPDARVEDLPVGVQQRVEIVKALMRDAEVLILDEPTAVLTPQETQELFTVMRGLKAAGKSVVFITHKLNEVRAIADRITVIRRGTVVGSPTPTATARELASLMVGRDVRLVVEKEPREPGEVALDVRNLTVRDDRGFLAVDDVSFALHAGEILGVAGVQGNGQTELVEAITGLRAATGSAELFGEQLVGASPRAVLRQGLGHVPEDRQHDGLVPDFSIAENLVLDQYDRTPFGGLLRLDLDAIEKNGAERLAEFDIRAESERTPAGALSGGNQQKVVVARALQRDPSLLIASQPTRGVDVGAMEFIHKRIVEQRDAGKAVLIVSTELDEITALADRIAVMYRGRIVGIVPPDTSNEELGLLMAGSSAAEAEAADATVPAARESLDDEPVAEPADESTAESTATSDAEPAAEETTSAEESSETADE